MTLGDKFHSASTRVVSKFANTGFIVEPPIDQDYDPLTGDVGHTAIKHPFKYVTVTNRTDPNTSLKATSYRESVIWCSVDSTLVINETWFIEDIYAVIFDIIGTEKVVVNNIIVGYYFLIKGRE